MYKQHILILILILVGTGCASKINSALEYSGEKTHVKTVESNNIGNKMGNETYVFMWIAEAYRRNESASANHRILVVNE